MHAFLIGLKILLYAIGGAAALIIAALIILLIWLATTKSNPFQ